MVVWEYLSVVLYAGTDNAGTRAAVARIYPKWTPPKHAPELLMANLNYFGSVGWELVSLHPYIVDQESNLTMPNTPTNAYLAVFKRQIS